MQLRKTGAPCASNLYRIGIPMLVVMGTLNFFFGHGEAEKVGWIVVGVDGSRVQPELLLHTRSGLVSPPFPSHRSYILPAKLQLRKSETLSP